MKPEHCDLAARDLMLFYGDVVIALSVVLRIGRTPDGLEIDQIFPGNGQGIGDGASPSR